MLLQKPVKQEVEVAGVRDHVNNVEDSRSASITFTASGGEYRGITEEVDVTVKDHDDDDEYMDLDHSGAVAT